MNAQPDTLDCLIEHHAGTKPAPPRPPRSSGSTTCPSTSPSRTADLIDVKPWPIYTLADQGKVRAIRHGGGILVSRQNVESTEMGVLRAVAAADD